MSKGLTAEMVAAVAKLMGNLDLVYAASKIRVSAHCNTTIGLRGTMATRLQPNHSSCLLYTSTPYEWEGEQRIIAHFASDVQIEYEKSGENWRTQSVKSLI